MADNTMFSVLLTIISSLIAYLELSIALVHMNIVRQWIRNNFRQSLMSKDTRKATRRSQPYKQRRFWTRPGRTSAWWDNFVNEVVVAEEWRENFRMSRGNYHGLNVLLTGACSKRDKAVAPPIKRCSVDAEHIIRFHVWTENFCSFFAPKVAFSNLSGIVWTRPHNRKEIVTGRYKIVWACARNSVLEVRDFITLKSQSWSSMDKNVLST